MPIRIALASLPQLLRDIVVGALSREGDMAVVAEAEAAPELRSLVSESGADVAIVACEPSDIDRVHRLVNGRPVTLLAITEEGRQGALYELRPRKTDLGELSPDVLVNAIRQAASRA